MVGAYGGSSLQASAKHKSRTSVQVQTENTELDSNESEESNEMARHLSRNANTDSTCHGLYKPFIRIC